MSLSTSIHLLGNLLGQVLREQESQALFDLEERIRSPYFSSGIKTSKPA